MTVPFFDLKRQYQQIKGEIGEALSSVLDSGRFILGENVAKLEEEVAAYCGVKHAVGVASGTDALHLSLRALDVGPGDEVIVPAFTFIATAEVVSYAGATSVFVDIEPKTYSLSPSEIEKKISPKTKAIIPVHLFGQSADMDPILEVARKHKLAVIEDAAQAMGAKYKGKKVASLGDAGCLSFFPTKNLAGYGDGGMVLTNNSKIAEKVRMLRAHGSSHPYYHDLLGFNSRLDELQAAILRVKLKHLDEWIKLRRKNANLYHTFLKGSPIILPQEESYGEHVYNQYTIRVRERDRLREHLKTQGIGTMLYYPLCLPQQKVFSSLGYKRGDFRVSEQVQEEVLSLPIFPELKESEVSEVAQSLRSFLS